ncbi:hypothetical protein [Dokdonella sp.]|uniref:TolB family protein n=1 Tax=Dokdonella sp. TaxID=2291710 RepID=UPI0025BA3ED4|nr:hypothetical protein [Dokdonella sp.]MBX3692416.1 hypothetical protein [Dokdonella sp.]
MQEIAMQFHRRLAAALVVGSATVLSCPAEAGDFVYARLVPGVGMQPDGPSETVDMSADGRTVVFSSSAANWASSGSFIGNRALAIDLHTGAIDVVSRNSGAGTTMRGERPAVSGDGRYVAFLTFDHPQAPNWQVMRRDRQTGILVMASRNAAGVPSSGTDDDTVSISTDGRYIALETNSENFGLTPGAWQEIFVKDMDTGAVEMASVKADGTPSGGQCDLYPKALSGDGRYIVFKCNQPIVPGATWGQVYVRDLVTDTTELVSRLGAAGASSTAGTTRPAISPNGRYVSFQNGAHGGLGYANGANVNGNSGIYVRDRQTQTTIAIPRPAIIPANDYDSCTVSSVSNLGSLTMACTMDTPSGRLSQVFTYVPGQPSPTLVSVNGSGQPGNGHSGNTLAVNGSGLSMAWESRASDLAPGDSNGFSDIFVLVHSSLLSDVIFASGFDN